LIFFLRAWRVFGEKEIVSGWREKSMAQGQKGKEAQESLDKVVRASQSQSHPRRYFELHSDFHVYDGYEHGSHRWVGSMPSESPRLLRLFSFSLSATLKKKFSRKIVEKKLLNARENSAEEVSASRARIKVFFFDFPLSAIAR
jgi:hypothetical protein